MLHRRVGRLFLFKQGLGRSSQGCLLVLGTHAALAGAEIIAEVRTIFFANDIRLGFPAFVVNFRIVMFAVLANMDIRAAMRTLIPPPDIPGEVQFFAAVKTADRRCHRL